MEDDLAEVDYGAWTGRSLKDLAEENSGGWCRRTRRPRSSPRAKDSPTGGPSGRRGPSHGGRVGPDGYLVICSHGDVIKAVLADALGLHLDGFQRIVVAPASLSVIRYTELRPFVERVNDTGDLDALRPPPPAPPRVKGRSMRRRSGRTLTHPIPTPSPAGVPD